MKHQERSVIKVGSRGLVLANGQPNKAAFKRIAQQVNELKKQGIDVAIVSSGAIALGRVKQQATTDLESVADKQVLASIGQTLLMEQWAKALASHGYIASQVLVSDIDLHGLPGQRGKPLHDMLMASFAWGVVPIVNENDAVAVSEIKYGDNDQLAAYFARYIGATNLFLLGTADAFYVNDKRQVLVQGTAIANTWGKHAKGTSDPTATGGMVTKLLAADIMTGTTYEHGSPAIMYIASVLQKDAIKNALIGVIGTKFTA